ncbi:NADH-quinone oxidoreductase subunit NuoG [Candidatus Endowatersipora endosymbiont of Watersipora subatra]|uniref:NADH-quinone oxidoreductase subunit NuoG n=1 Tax=Candidatus Endowatersipora endosymbiont of Watersipora subatra TaxID=3077946 RepID=UPI00312C7338
MVKIVIDGIEREVPEQSTLLEGIESLGIEVPRFCFHKRLSIAGNCRMCLVEIRSSSAKLVPSCAMRFHDLSPGLDGKAPEIFTNTLMVKKAREGVMEFLLINHPLDCPICDQGGECDLQDQAMAFGMDKSRYSERKRAVEDKNVGPLVKTVMTRCIHCTRCVRFMNEVAGISELGLIGRGEDAEITTYLEKAMASELQGNVIDLCPVGALTSKPSSLQARPWELNKTDTIDVMDAVGSAIRVETFGSEVIRIVPRTNENVNEEWISDKTRFIFDGLRTQRLDHPYIRKQGKLVLATWKEAFLVISEKIDSLDSSKIGAIAGDLASVEEMYAMKQLMKMLGSKNMDCREQQSALDPALGRSSYLFNSTISGIEESEFLLLVGTNPRKEAAVLNTRIRKRWITGKLEIMLVGENADLTYDYHHLGLGPDSIQKVVDHLLIRRKNPMIIVGQGALNREDGAAILSSLAQIAQSFGVVTDRWNGFNILHTAAGRVGGLDLDFVPGKGGHNREQMLEDSEILFLLAADEVDIMKRRSGLTVYIGSHGDVGAHHADIILPGAAYTEKSGTWVNTEGRVQMSKRACLVPGDAREDWAILRALSEALGKTLPFNSLQQLRLALYNEYPHFSDIDKITYSDNTGINALALRKYQPLSKSVFKPHVEDFYFTNPIARSSSIMASCSLSAQGTSTEIEK